MEEKHLHRQAKEALEHFQLQEKLGEVRPWGSGHINDTFLVEGPCDYILQRMNHDVFKDHIGLMENIIGVTTFLRKKITENSGNPEREALTVVCTQSRKS